MIYVLGWRHPRPQRHYDVFFFCFVVVVVVICVTFHLNSWDVIALTQQHPDDDRNSRGHRQASSRLIPRYMLTGLDFYCAL